ncbi:hypothetical protein BDV27DRAFT_5268 [Aspergillus caelatus]|uniref:Uncharacterized protein n=1 Tax=Aspergillus caelatus TaxID=61420 RepID=A0A5N7A344_9EURO|nr:uncharacterized protein BDV27DRAFT_5268 [Aspergillus caelatus]KAE8363606.1 hypothetical protein BDV27DRAFT_5268 [Aspergillus caelatus]
MRLVTPVTQKTRLVNLVTQRMRTAPADQLTFRVRIGILPFYFIGGLMTRRYLEFRRVAFYSSIFGHASGMGI